VPDEIHQIREYPGPSGSRSGHHKEPSRRTRTRDGG
jgi:hypothetical protein